jgi:hypothetical protein
VCQECDQLFAILLQLMERGAVVEVPKAKKQKVSDGPIRAQSKRVPASELPTTCPDCGFHSVSRSALGQHLRMKHEGKGFKDFTEEQMAAAETDYQNSLTVPQSA